MGIDEEKRTREVGQEPELGLMLCCHHLDILNHLEQGAPYFHFASGPTNDAAGSSWDTVKFRGLVGKETPAKSQKQWLMRQREARESCIRETLQLSQGQNG